MTRPRVTLRSTPEDFVVDEVPLYEPQGTGEHLYALVRKRGVDTMEAVRRLAKRLGASPRDAGTAGLKDKWAVTTQWVSFAWPLAKPVPEATALSGDDVEVLRLARHANKLKTGHLAGNRFTLVLRDLTGGAEDEVVAAYRAIGERGLPNAFGVQRFGRGGENGPRALAWLRGEGEAPRDPKLKRLLLSALQSELFNDVLARRTAEGTADRVLTGDLVQLGDSHKVFLSTDGEADSARAARGEVTATGPMFGVEMRSPEGHPAELEAAVLRERLGSIDLFRPHARIAEGARRPLWLRPRDLGVTVLQPMCIRLSFVLPKGAYATEVVAAVCDAVPPPRSETPAPAALSPEAESPQDPEE